MTTVPRSTGSRDDQNNPSTQDPSVQKILIDCHFDSDRLAAQQEALKKRAYAPEVAYLASTPAPMRPEDSVPVTPNEALAAQWRARGEAALAAGEVAFLLLNGGMATRFGGVAKGAAQAWQGRSFMELRMRQAWHAVRQVSAHARIPCVLMNSFATQTASLRHLEEHNYFGFSREDVHVFQQGVSKRLTPDGDVFLDASGAESLYTPGHGDLPWALHNSGVAAKLQAAGVKTLFVSNVDNVGCSLDALVLGAHLQLAESRGAAMSVELIARGPNDVGGAPMYVDGRLQLVEGFRLPPAFDQSQLVGFNTNTFYFQWNALDPAGVLGFYPVAKKVDGRTAIQFERIVGERTASVPTAYMMVDRDPERGRFLPVKTPEDLANMQPLLARRYAHVFA